MQNAPSQMSPTIEDVQRFWDGNPLFTDESRAKPGSPEFFHEHTKACLAMFGGRISEAVWPNIAVDEPLLDLGCGVGFWLEQFWQRGYRNITGADLSRNSLDIAARRCAWLGANVTLVQQNAQSMSFEDASFQHINCIGVIHHSPDPAASIAEIARVLRPGGTAAISVYNWNFALRVWPAIRPIATALGRRGVTLKGRGREKMMDSRSGRELVRLYDGADNPIGYAYSRREFASMLTPHFQVESIIGHVFPARVLPAKLPTPLFRTMEKICPFMICGLVRKALI